MAPSPHPVLVIACGALAREISVLLGRDGLRHIRLLGLPAMLHNRPERIAPAVRAAIMAALPTGAKLFVAYAECGTGGELDRVLAEFGAERLAGAHCYAVYTGVERFAAIGDADMRCFYLTDFLARQFRALVIEPLGLDRHPELRDAYFGQYEKLVHLAQTDDPFLNGAARAAAELLGLAHERRFTCYGDLAPAIERLA